MNLTPDEARKKTLFVRAVTKDPLGSMEALLAHVENAIRKVAGIGEFEASISFQERTPKGAVERVLNHLQEAGWKAHLVSERLILMSWE